MQRRDIKQINHAVIITIVLIFQHTAKASKPKERNQQSFTIPIWIPITLTFTCIGKYIIWSILSLSIQETQKENETLIQRIETLKKEIEYAESVIPDIPEGGTLVQQATYAEETIRQAITHISNRFR